MIFEPMCKMEDLDVHGKVIDLSVAHLSQTEHMNDIVPLCRCYTPGTNGGLVVHVCPWQTVWRTYTGNSGIAPLNGTEWCH